MTEYTLYGFWESGNAYKVALMLELNQADWVCKRVAFFSGETRGETFRELNVMGEVPVLIHHRADGDFTLTQSGACLTYLSKQFGTFGPQSETEEYDVLRWLLFDSQKMSGFAGPLRFLRHLTRKTESDDTAFLHARLTASLKALNAQLEGRKFIMGERPTIADFACQGYLHWPEQIGISYDETPNVSAWLERIRALPGYKRSEDLMPSGRDQETATA